MSIVLSHWNPIAELSGLTQHHAANMLVAAGKIMRAKPDGFPFLMDLDDIRKAHAAIGAALASYDGSPLSAPTPQPAPAGGAL